MTERAAERPPVRVERNGPVTTVIIDRPGVRNAIDRPTAEGLARAFLDFKADDDTVPSPPLRAEWRSNPPFLTPGLDCFVAHAPRNDDHHCRHS